MNKKKVMLAAIVLALVLSIGGVLAYFSDSDEKTNTFTVGKISIQLTEPTWDSTGKTKAESVLPNQLIDKDPKITNNGKNPAYVFIKVSIPNAEVTTETEAGEDGTQNTLQPLFKLMNNATPPAEGVNEGWVLVSTKNGDATNPTEYVYAYGTETEMEALAVGASTTNPLFSKIKFANVQEGWNIEEHPYDVVVTGYAIQTENLNGGKVKPSDVWDVLKANAINPSTKPQP